MSGRSTYRNNKRDHQHLSHDGWILDQETASDRSKNIFWIIYIHLPTTGMSSVLPKWKVLLTTPVLVVSSTSFHWPDEDTRIGNPVPVPVSRAKK